MTLTAENHCEIVSLLEMWVSPFNIRVHPNGLVIFYSGGLRPDEIECARYMLVKYLASLPAIK